MGREAIGGAPITHACRTPAADSRNGGRAAERVNDFGSGGRCLRHDTDSNPNFLGFQDTKF
jgi:hypothetical protein